MWACHNIINWILFANFILPSFYWTAFWRQLMVLKSNSSGRAQPVLLGITFPNPHSKLTRHRPAMRLPHYNVNTPIKACWMLAHIPPTRKLLTIFSRGCTPYWTLYSHITRTLKPHTFSKWQKRARPRVHYYFSHELSLTHITLRRPIIYSTRIFMKLLSPWSSDVCVRSSRILRVFIFLHHPHHRTASSSSAEQTSILLLLGLAMHAASRDSCHKKLHCCSP
jgi:hypothetical protein